MLIISFCLYVGVLSVFYICDVAPLLGVQKGRTLGHGRTGTGTRIHDGMLTHTDGYSDQEWEDLVIENRLMFDMLEASKAARAMLVRNIAS